MQVPEQTDSGTIASRPSDSASNIDTSTLTPYNPEVTTPDTTSARPPATASSSYYWVIIGSGFFLVMAAMGFGRFTYPMLLPSMQESLGQTYGPMGVLGTMNLIGYVTGSLGAGVLVTRRDVRVLVTACMILVGLCMVALGMVTTYLVALGIMLLSGMGTGGVFTPIAGLARAWAPPNVSGFTMGFLSSGATLGTVVSTFFIPIILVSQGQEGWRQAWIYMGATALVLTLLGALTLKQKPQARSSSGLAGAATPLAWGQVFRNRTIAGICVAYFLFGFFQIYVTFFVAYLRRALDLPAAMVGSIWLVFAVVGLPFLALLGLLSDRIGRKQAMALCMIPLLAGVILPIFQQDVPFLYVSAALFGLTFGAPMQMFLAAAADAVPVKLAAASVGLVTAAFGLGQGVSPAIAGYLTDLTGSFYPGFALSAVVMALSLATFVLLPSKRAT